MKSSIALSSLFTIGLVAGCAQADAGPAQDYAADRAAIEAIRASEQASAEAGDVEAFLSMTADDMAIYAPNAPPMTGPGAAREFFEGMVGANTVSFESYRTDDVMISGDLAVEYISGTWTVTPKDGSPGVTENVKGVHVYRRTADGWKMVLDLWNSNDPPPGM